jgi:hypothetical protein
MIDEELPTYEIGNLVIVMYDCWIHNFQGSIYVRKGELAVVVQKRNKLMYKPIRILTSDGREGWVYSSNIRILEK